MEGASAGLAGLITALQTTWTVDAMWGAIIAAGGFIGTLILFGFGYRVVRRLISGASKGKAKV